MDAPRPLRTTVLFVGPLTIALVALFAFGWLANEVVDGETARFDAGVRALAHQTATPGLTVAMLAISFLGSVAAVVTIGALAVGVCLSWRRRHAALLIAITLGGAALLETGLKLAFHRSRPVPFFGTAPGSFAFPSGHALFAACLYGVLAAMLAAHARRTLVHVGIWCGALLLIGLIGWSRIYLGVHYPSDVVAGYCVAAWWVGAVAFVDRTRGGEGWGGPATPRPRVRA